MDIIIQSLGFNAGSSLETFIKDKVGALKSDQIIRANVTLFKESTGSTDNDYCEIRLEVPGNDLFVKKHSAHFETSISECVEILSQKIKDAKEKHLHELKANQNIIQDALLEGEESGEVELEDVVK